MDGADMHPGRSTTPAPQPSADPAPAARILVVEDDPELIRAYQRVLRAAGFAVEPAATGTLAAAALERPLPDVVLSDIDLPGLNGIELLRLVRARDLDLPVVLVTGNPRVETAIEAVRHGALRYLVKPVPPRELIEALDHAVKLRRLATLKREAVQLAAGDRYQVGDRAGVEALFARALDGLWMAYQPIVSWSQRRIFALEALVRSREPAMATPGALLDAAERLDRLPELGRRIRAQAAAAAREQPDTLFFVNLHPRDLLDDDLYAPSAPLTQLASRVVLELTERAALDELGDVRARIAALRALGFRIAVDDLGAGYAGLASFAQLEPEVVKLDMSLVRDVHLQPTKRKLVRSMAALAVDLGLQLVVEGVETAAERDTLVEVGCDLLQGYLFARPAAVAAEIPW
jgi:EAL domain-containing protein (putative c-di-GMP-specific phosphodiesterase class I)